MKDMGGLGAPRPAGPRAEPDDDGGWADRVALPRPPLELEPLTDGAPLDAAEAGMRVRVKV